MLLKSLSEVDEARLALQNVDRLSGKYVLADEATYIVQSTEAQKCPELGADVFRLATPAEFVASPLCRGRAAPELYDMHKLQRELRGKRFALARPDRFVYAACNSGEELERICSGIQHNLGLM